MTTTRTPLIREVKSQTLILFGNPKDPEVAERINKAFIQGKKIEVQSRPSFDTGLGHCGNHLCSCKTICKEQYTKDRAI